MKTPEEIKSEIIRLTQKIKDIEKLSYNPQEGSQPHHDRQREAQALFNQVFALQWVLTENGKSLEDSKHGKNLYPLPLS